MNSQIGLEVEQSGLRSGLRLEFEQSGLGLTRSIVTVFLLN